MNEEGQQLAPDEGLVRLFPLPNLVLFPQVVQPLHIFEPRYRQLMADSLADDRRIAMALLQPGWEEDYHKRPPIYPVICLGQIHQEERLFDGRYNLLLQGLRRGTVLEEIVTDRLYRTARVRWIDDQPPTNDRADVLTQSLAVLLTRWAGINQATDAVARLLQQGHPPALLSDVLAFSLSLPLEDRQELLAEPCVESRMLRLIAWLEGQMPRSFPPAFSVN